MSKSTKSQIAPNGGSRDAEWAARRDGGRAKHSGGTHMDRNIGNVTGKWSTGRGRLVAALAALGAVTAVSSVAGADIISDLGLAGGDNMVAIVQVLQPGEISFPAGATDFGAVQVKVGPKVKFGARCKRSGYRCQKVVGFTTTVFDTKQSEEDGEIEANLLAVVSSKSKYRDDVVKALRSACEAKQATVQLPVAVRLTCKKVKFALGDSTYSPGSEAVQATYKITCN